jgi:hypothetical protein
MEKIKEKKLCSGCCIIFEKLLECPRCGKTENLHPYLEADCLFRINTDLLPKV